MRNKSKYSKVADVAGKVEVVSRGVKDTATELDSKYGNDGHRATRADRSRGVIVRDRDAALPDIGARLFVDPLDGEKTVYALNISLEVGDPAANSIASTYVRDYLYPAYENAIVQGIKYDVSSLLSEAKFRDYHDHILDALAAYYFVSYQRAFMSNSSITSKSFSVRDNEIYGPSVEESLKVMRNRLQQYCVSPPLVKMMDWLFQIRPMGRTPNANLAQFCEDTNLLTAADDDAISIILRSKLTALDSDDGKVSSLLGKIQPDWRIKLDHYTDLSFNPELDFNWINIWINFGSERPAPIDNQPYNFMEYVLFNDNPNAMCTALSTIYDSTGIVWDPGLLVPKSALTTNTYIINDSTGEYNDLARASDRLLGCYRYYDYIQGAVPIGISASTPESVTVRTNAIDAKPDTQSMIKYLYSLETIQSSGLNCMRNLVAR